MRLEVTEMSRMTGLRRLLLVGCAVLVTVALITAIVAANRGAGVDWSANLVRNGSFEEVAGLKGRSFGFLGDPPNWTSATPGGAELIGDGIVGMPARDGEYWLDMGQAAARVVDISQKVENLAPGTALRLIVHAGQWRRPSEPPDETLNVYWGGRLVATVRPETVGGYESFEFDVVAGAGDGTDTLRLEGVGDETADNQGVAVDQVGLFAQPASGEDGAPVVVTEER